MTFVGVHNLSNSYEPNRIVAAVSSINMHPDWNPNVERYDADLAVLVLNIPLTFNQFIIPICMIVPNSPAASVATGMAIGYGKSEDRSKYHEDIPKVLGMPIHDDGPCFRKFSSLAKYASSRTFCAGNDNGTNVCQGDSGGGFFVRHDGTYYLRGVISASIFDISHGCSVKSYALFTDLVNFSDWIEAVPVDLNRG